MGIWAKIGLGFLGLCIAGAVASQFAYPVPPEKDLEFGQRFLKNQCPSQTRNQTIAGKGAAAISIACAYLRTSTWF